MATFLRVIGGYNIFGALIMMAMHYNPVADFFMRRGTEIVADRYEHLGYARMWLWSAAMTTLFLGVVMVRAVDWPVRVQREVALYAVGVYLIGWLAVCAGMRRPRYGRGVYALHPLWLGQMAWGVWAVWQSGR